jgi:hypothetical protein
MTMALADADPCLCGGLQGFASRGIDVVAVEFAGLADAADAAVAGLGVAVDGVAGVASAASAAFAAYVAGSASVVNDAIVIVACRCALHQW